MTVQMCSFSLPGHIVAQNVTLSYTWRGFDVNSTWFAVTKPLVLPIFPSIELQCRTAREGVGFLPLHFMTRDWPNTFE